LPYNLAFELVYIKKLGKAKILKDVKAQNKPCYISAILQPFSLNSILNYLGLCSASAGFITTVCEVTDAGS
jgi:hypothetical protein